MITELMGDTCQNLTFHSDFHEILSTIEHFTKLAYRHAKLCDKIPAFYMLGVKMSEPEAEYECLV